MAFKMVFNAPEKLDLADELLEEFHAQAKDAVEGAATIVLREIKRKLTQVKGTPRTSAPEGQPPEYDTGALEKSYRLLSGRVKGNVASSGVQSKDPGANRLEMGFTDNRGIRTFPHPHVRTSFQDTYDDVTAYLNGALL